MGYNYKMHDKNSQQQAIVRQREREDELRKKESDNKNKISCKVIERTGNFEAVLFTIDLQPILELRVNESTIANQSCGLSEEIIHEWIENVGKGFIKKTKIFETVLITSKDVVNSELVTEWANLNRI